VTLGAVLHVTGLGGTAAIQTAAVTAPGVEFDAMLDVRPLRVSS